LVVDWIADHAESLLAAVRRQQRRFDVVSFKAGRFFD
jgi:hypothetical protein